MARLIVNPGTPQAQEIRLKEGVNNLGRNPGNDFTINDPSVSGSHCQVILSDGAVRLRDLGSTNGTFVNGVQVTEVDLRAGENIRLGVVPLILEEDAADQAAVAAPEVQTAATPAQGSIA